MNLLFDLKVLNDRKYSQFKKKRAGVGAVYSFLIKLLSFFFISQQSKPLIRADFKFEDLGIGGLDT